MPPIYFDNNATTQPAPEAVDAMLPFLREQWGNPSSMHAFGGGTAKAVDRARGQVAALLNADPSEILFTSCGTESNNAAFFGAAEIHGAAMRIITTRVEHPAVLGPARRLRERGHSVAELGVDGRGRLDAAALRQALAGGGPAFVSTMWANNETGTLFPVHEIAEIAKASGAIVHTDAVQAVGKERIDVAKTPVDMLSLSGHKIHAPKGVGALYVRRGTRLKAWMLGGHQENGRRGGTENVPHIIALGVAAELAVKHLEDGRVRVASLRDRLERGILQTCPGSRVNGDVENRLPNTTNISFEFIEGEAILYHLSDAGICASSGSACASGSLEPSHVIRAMGVPFTSAHGSIRFSLGRYNTDADVDAVLAALPPIVQKLRAMSPFVK